MIIPSYKPAFIYGGPIRSVAALCEALHARGIAVSVYTTNANGEHNLPVDINKAMNVDGAMVTYFKRVTGDHSNFSPALLRSFWNNCSEFDVIHIHSWWNLVSIPVMLMCVFRRITPVLSPRGSITSYTVQHQKSSVKRLFHLVAGKRLVQKAVLHVTAQQELDDVEKFVKPKLTHIIPNILQLAKVSTTDNDLSDKLKLLYFGRIDPKKNIAFLFETLLQDFSVPFTLELVGDGDEAYINSLKNSTAGKSMIQWSGPVHSDAKWQKLANADLLLLPSFNENYGNVILESLSQGTPVLISDQVGLKDYVEKNKLGWVVANHKMQWRRQLQYIWENPTERATIRQKAPIAIQRDFNENVLTDLYLDMYEQVKHLNQRHNAE